MAFSGFGINRFFSNLIESRIERKLLKIRSQTIGLILLLTKVVQPLVEITEPKTGKTQCKNLTVQDMVDVSNSELLGLANDMMDKAEDLYHEHVV